MQKVIRSSHADRILGQVDLSSIDVISIQVFFINQVELETLLLGIGGDGMVQKVDESEISIFVEVTERPVGNQHVLVLLDLLQ